MGVTDHWQGVSQRWQQLGPPLRPTVEDLSAYAPLAEELALRPAPRQVLLLGVTPEVCRYPWPLGTRVLAVDHTPAMIEAVWPGSRADVRCAEWTALPPEANGSSLAICDGGLHLLPYPAGQGQFVRELARVLPEGGALCLRLFRPPVAPEQPAAVLEDLMSGQVPSLNVLKLRMGMAMQQDAETGVALADIWKTVSALAPSWQELAARLDWPLEHLAALDSYRDATNRYHFVTLEETEALFAPHFRRASVHVPTYVLGERCPTVVFRRT